MKCAVCKAECHYEQNVLGEPTPMCFMCAKEWERWGALAGLVAFLLRRAERPWTIGDCERHGGHDFPGLEVVCRRCGGLR